MSHCMLCTVVTPRYSVFWSLSPPSLEWSHFVCAICVEFTSQMSDAYRKSVINLECQIGIANIYDDIKYIYVFLSSIYVTVASVEEWHGGAFFFLQTLPNNWNVNSDWTLWIVLSYKNVQFSRNLCLDFHHSGVYMLLFKRTCFHIVLI